MFCIVILDRKTGIPVCILDTKYKVPDSPSSSDIHEVRSYAEALACKEAVLVYPSHLLADMDVKAGNIRVRTLTFATDGDVDAAGRAFLESLL